MAKITADTLIADVLQINPNSPEILLSAGMHCFGCALAHNETVAEAVAVHGEDLEALLAKLNEGLND
jgi:hydroxylamine reductase